MSEKQNDIHIPKSEIYKKDESYYFKHNINHYKIVAQTELEIKALKRIFQYKEHHSINIRINLDTNTYEVRNHNAGIAVEGDITRIKFEKEL